VLNFQVSSNIYTKKNFRFTLKVTWKKKVDF